MESRKWWEVVVAEEEEVSRQGRRCRGVGVSIGGRLRLGRLGGRCGRRDEAPARLERAAVTAPVPDSCVTSVTSPTAPQMAGKKQQQQVTPPPALSVCPREAVLTRATQGNGPGRFVAAIHPSPRPQRQPVWLTPSPLAPDRPRWVCLSPPSATPQLTRHPALPPLSGGRALAPRRATTARR